MKDDDRASAQDWFLASDDGIVVATIAFGMESPTSRTSATSSHYNCPKSLENYSQANGPRRAVTVGRRPVKMLLCMEDLNVL